MAVSTENVLPTFEYIHIVNEVVGHTIAMTKHILQKFFVANMFFFTMKAEQELEAIFSLPCQHTAEVVHCLLIFGHVCAAVLGELNMRQNTLLKEVRA